MQSENLENVIRNIQIWIFCAFPKLPGRLKMRDVKIGSVENAVHDNAKHEKSEPNSRGGKCET